MSGKSKRKDKSKPKKDEIEFNTKLIDLKRFAYDVIKYTALKFHVPESCIAVWQGSDNDYGYDDFFLVLCSEIIRYQITNRYQYHTTFRQHYKSNKLASSNLIGMLLQEVINKATEEPSLTPLHKVEISLSVVCELVLYLYSKDMDLHPKQLATTWFQCYLNINKKYFEAAGGLKEMYSKGCRSKVDDMDAFINKFIEDHCLPYITTASNGDLKEIYYQSVHERNQKAAESLSPKDCEEMKKILERVKEMGKRPPTSLNSKNGEAVAVKPPEQDEASRVNLSHNPRLGIIPHDEVMLHFFGPSIASSQEPPASTTEQQPRHNRTLSYKERMKRKKSSSLANVEKGLGKLSLDSSGTKQSSEKTPSVQVDKDTTQSYCHQGAKSETEVENGRSASQAGKSSLCSSEEQGPERWIADFNLLGVKSDTEVENGGSSASQAGKSSFCSSEEQDPKQWIADFNLLGAKSETEVENGGFSASQAGKSSLCSSEEQGPAPFSLDFNLLEDKSEPEVENGRSSSETIKSNL